ncbi:Zinc finger, BED-type [Sesbania bispinosa]|nr:Zinc finger, BED-type [Sesbania bispinosa]
MGTVLETLKLSLPSNIAPPRSHHPPPPRPRPRHRDCDCERSSSSPLFCVLRSRLRLRASPSSLFSVLCSVSLLVSVFISAQSLRRPFELAGCSSRLCHGLTAKMSSQQSSSSSVSSSTSSRYTSGEVSSTNPLWAYVTMLQNKKEGGGNASWRCNYCNIIYKGSYFRVKSHLLKEKGHGIAICSQVSNDCLEEMKKIEREAMEKSKPVHVPLPTGTTSFNPSLDGGKRRRAETPIGRAFNNEARDHLSCEIARLFYSAGLPFNLARNPYFISAFSYAANNPISGFLPPSYNAIRTTLLQREKAHILKLLQPIKDTWSEKGVSLVTDGWTDAQRRPLINFMAISDSGPMFLKVVDGSGEFKDKHYISDLMFSVIDEIGPQNVVQIITDNAPVCKAAGSIVESIHHHIFWTPCVVHTLNLALKDICCPKNTENNVVVYEACNWISSIADDAFFIKNFIMNHSMRLAMFNQFVHLKLLAVAETRFASIIIMLKRMRTIKHGLQSMVISEQWSHYREDNVQKVASVKEIILNDCWWDQVDYVLNFTSPIYDMLRSCDTDEPSLHLFYEKWDSMIEKVKLAIYQHEGKELNEHSSFYEVVYGVLIFRWTKSNTPLHCLAHSLNPRYYCRQWLEEVPNRVPPHRDNEICVGRNKCLRTYFPESKDRIEVTQEFVKFSSAAEDLGQFDSLQDRWNLKPKEWWIMYGSSIPKLQSIALKLLSQPSSSSCCERNWSTYSFIHSMKRNRLNPKRAEDLVFIHTNLRLLSRKGKSYKEGESKLWDLAADEWDPSEGVGVLEVASLSLDEPDLEAVLFTDDGDGNDEIDTVRV